MKPRLLITAGPTREPLDAVRYLSNRSSGTLGLALAHAAASAGHPTTLLLGPVMSSVGQASNLSTGETPVPTDASAPPFTIHRFETVDDLQRKLEQLFPDHDALIMAAAVGDYRLDPTKAPQKQGKTERKKELTLHLVGTPDVVAGIAQHKREDQTVIAFALEDPAQLEARAAEKMKRKGVDAIVANPLTTMDAADIDPVLLTADGHREAPGPMPKPAFAAWLINQLPQLHRNV